jgi:hypothetical protein
VFNHLTRGGTTVDPGQYAGIGRRINNPIDRWHILQIAPATDIAVLNPAAKRLQASTVEMSAGPDKIVDPNYLDIRRMFSNRRNEIRSDEPTCSGNQNSHPRLVLESADRHKRKMWGPAALRANHKSQIADRKQQALLELLDSRRASRESQIAIANRKQQALLELP